MICLVDERISEKCERSLLVRGFQVIKLPKSERLGDAVCSHPDMLMFCHRNRIIASADYCERYPYIFSDIRELSANTEFTFTDDVFEKEYPKDALFNALVIGDKIFIKTDTASPAVIDYARGRNLKIISVKQGYPACTVLEFGKNAITADTGMAKILSSAGIDVTLISNGGISLPPYKYGFIGGACGVYKSSVYFLGDISTHADGKKIFDTIKAKGYEPISLSDEPLRDLGRIIFID